MSSQHGRPILLGCFEPPSFGGASTSAYALYRSLAGLVDARYASLATRENVERLAPILGADMLNPDALPGAHGVVLEHPPFGPQAALGRLLEELDPSLLVGIGYIAAYVLKKARPQLPMVLITTGCQQVKDALYGGVIENVRQLLSGGAPLTITNDIEQQALASADIIVTHSELVRSLCGLYFPQHRSRLLKQVLWFYDWIHDAALGSRATALPFDRRDIDIVFVASDWDRVEKNYALVRALGRRFPDRSIHVVGAAGDPVPGARHHGLLPHREVLAILGRSRVLVCPSSFDAAPGILFEGAALGCNLVASTNCGNHQLCHPELLADPCTVDGFARSIARALHAPLAPNTHLFEASDSLRRLVALFGQFAAPRLSPATG